MKKYMPLIVLLLGCANPYTLAIEEEFTDREVEMIHEAADAWTIACDCNSAAIFFRYDLITNNNLTTNEWRKDVGFGRLWKTNHNEEYYVESIEVDE